MKPDEKLSGQGLKKKLYLVRCQEVNWAKNFSASPCSFLYATMGEMLKNSQINQEGPTAMMNTFYSSYSLCRPTHFIYHFLNFLNPFKKIV